LDGALANPFEDLDDALEKAMEYCAPFKSCSALILLLKGAKEHYLLRKSWNFYKATKVSRDQ
jgi:hypothetical protein